MSLVVRTGPVQEMTGLTTREAGQRLSRCWDAQVCVCVCCAAHNDTPGLISGGGGRGRSYRGTSSFLTSEDEDDDVAATPSLSLTHTCVRACG